MTIGWIEEVLHDLKHFSALNGLARLSDALDEAIHQTQLEGRELAQHELVYPLESDNLKPLN